MSDISKQVLNVQKMLLDRVGDEAKEDVGWYLGQWYFRDGLRCATDGRMAIVIECAEADHPPLNLEVLGRNPPDLRFVRDSPRERQWFRTLPTGGKAPAVMKVNDSAVTAVFWNLQTLVDWHYYALACMLPDAEWSYFDCSRSNLARHHHGPGILLRHYAEFPRWHARIMPMTLPPDTNLIDAEEKRRRAAWISQRCVAVE